MIFRSPFHKKPELFEKSQELIPFLTTREDLAIEQAERSSLLTLGMGVGLGSIGLIGYPMTIAGVGTTLLFIGLLIASASLMLGFFVGTLFGIPKRINDGNGDYSLNNSLVEIAEWLTKIIVGLGLVNLKQIPTYLLSMGTYVNEAANVVGKSASVFTMCVVVYFSVLGLYVGYNYMRLVLSLKYKASDQGVLGELNKAKEKLDTAEQKIAEQVKEVDTMKQVTTSLINIASQPEKKIEEFLDDAKHDARLKNTDDGVAGRQGYLTEMVLKANKKLAIGFVKNKLAGDPQKNMWGGKSESKLRKLTALINTLSVGLYEITLKLESTSVEHPLQENDVVLFALHNSFDPPYRLVSVSEGKADVKLYTYGSFTVGAFSDFGENELELNLADLPGVTKDFIEH